MALMKNISIAYLAAQNSGRRMNFCSIMKRKQKAKLLSTSAQTFDLQFVPHSGEASKEDVQKLADFVGRSERLFVLTGAGISTESGIPDYRSEGVGLYSKNRKPIMYGEFLKSDAMRQRYWARNYVGWPKFSSFAPNQSHVILSEWEHAGKIHWLVTQNVDTLHGKAGSQRVTELHGSTHRVMCLSCDNRLTRHSLQHAIKALNPEWQAHSVQIAPDGDIHLTEDQIEGFKVPSCEKCGGILKPDLVFFGDNVPRATVDLVYDRLAECDAMLVLGSSLEVYSAYRIALRAQDSYTPIAILNIGNTRGDKLAHLKIQARCGPVLQQVHNILTLSRS